MHGIALSGSYSLCYSWSEFKLTIQVPWLRQGFDKQWYIRSWQFVPCQPGGQEQLYPPWPSLRQVPPFWHGDCRWQGRRSVGVQYTITMYHQNNFVIYSCNKLLPTSQRLPEYPERQIHSFGSLQNPPTVAACMQIIILWPSKWCMCRNRTVVHK